MYVPTVGMNCETRPTQSPRANEYGTPRAKRNAQVTTAETAAWMPRRVEVAAGLVDGDLPGVEDDLLTGTGKPRTDGAPHARAVGGHVEREDEHGDEIEQPATHGQRDTDGARHDLTAVGVQRSVPSPELAHQGIGVEVDSEIVVDEPFEVAHVPGGLVDEVTRLPDDDRTRCGQEDERERKHATEHERGRATAAPSASSQTIDSRLHRERQEERDENHHQQRAQPLQRPIAGNQQHHPARGQRDGAAQPWRHRSVALGNGRRLQEHGFGEGISTRRFPARSAVPARRVAHRG